MVELQNASPHRGAPTTRVPCQSDPWLKEHAMAVGNGAFHYFWTFSPGLGGFPWLKGASFGCTCTAAAMRCVPEFRCAMSGLIRAVPGWPGPGRRKPGGEMWENYPFGPVAVN